MRYVFLRITLFAQQIGMCESRYQKTRVLTAKRYRPYSYEWASNDRKQYIVAVQVDLLNGNYGSSPVLKRNRI